MDGYVDRWELWVGRKVGGQMGGWTNGWMDQQKKAQVADTGMLDVLVGGQVDRQVDG